MSERKPTPIGAHGVIGDLETLALIGRGATVEWMCWPRFDSPSIFGCLLDDDGGFWSIWPSDVDFDERQLYIPDTNVMVTRFQHRSGIVEVEDFLNVIGDTQALVRRVCSVRGDVQMSSSMKIRPDYGRGDTKMSTDEDGRVGIDIGSETLHVAANVELVATDDAVEASFTLSEGEAVVFTLGDIVEQDWDTLSEHNEAYWREWISSSTYRGRWRETVNRSALVLKALTHRSSGGMIAAGTTSLPETLEGDRNWDYRYVWIRDAAFTLYAFLELGFVDEAEAFTGWLLERVSNCKSDDENGLLSPLYDLDGNGDLPETELEHWSGYRGVGPVRIGNGASGQLQLDLYGELLDSMYLADRAGEGLSLDTWSELRVLIDWVCANWDQPDDGIWEVRSGRDRFTSSALMCWVALDRGIRMATSRGRPADLERWRRTRDEIHETITEKGWNNELGAFTQTFGGDTVDASILLMPLVNFVAGGDPKWLSTLDAVRDQLVRGVLVDRYDNDAVDDGLEGDDGSFSICSFWFVEALTRAGRVEEARTMFEKILTFAGPLGLFSEVISPAGQQLGNYPQAFTHLSLISAAVHLDEALDNERRRP